MEVSGERANLEMESQTKDLPSSFTLSIPSNDKLTLLGLPISFKLIISFSLFCSLQVLMIYVFSISKLPFFANNLPSCDSKIAPFYIYDLPSCFNDEVLSYCYKTQPWTNRCPQLANHGFGQPAGRSGWYNTDQFTLEIIFHARASNHPCRTYDPSSARLFYIPFYMGYYWSYMYNVENNTVRDAMALDLAKYLSNISSFTRYGGHDNFIVGGHVVWDFLRSNDPKGFAYNTRMTRILTLPEFSNVSVLIIERETYNLKGSTRVGIPYPSYFHPSTRLEMTAWQDEVRRSDRNHLLAFIGGGRQGNGTAATIRSEILRQCGSSERCLLINCKVNPRLCRSSDWIMAAMKRAQFCLQPPGDTPTRRSMFDALLAGCIPVFFSEHSAYNQYPWYIPEKREDWSVLIAQDKVGEVEQILAKIPMEEVERMREVVVGMIPNVMYVDPNATQIGFHDAVDIALIELTKRIDYKLNISI